MCGRFFTAIEREEIQRIIDEVNRRIADKEAIEQMKIGEIYPTNVVPVYVNTEGGAAPTLMSWGFPGFLPPGSKASKAPPIINARSETVKEKPSFRSYIQQRCLIPANKYFEWAQNVRPVDGKKPKYAFAPKDEDMSLFWFAAIYRVVQGEKLPVFTILTMDASESVAPIHHRMPVILGRKEARRAWIMGENDLEGLFKDEAVRDMRCEPCDVQQIGFF